MDASRPRRFLTEAVQELQHYSAVHAIAWSPEGALLASGSDDSEAIVRRAESGEVVHELQHISIVPAAETQARTMVRTHRDVLQLGLPWPGTMRATKCPVCKRPKAVVHMAVSGLMDRELYTLADLWKPHAQGGS